MPSCRYCADKITQDGKSLTGFPCIGGHEHEPWPDLEYVECEIMPGVSIMRLISHVPTNN